MTSKSLSKTKPLLVSIVAPFFNEQENVESYYNSVVNTVASLENIDFEFVCVDDGSDDRTLALLESLSVSDSRVVVLELSRNFGKEAALTAGIDAASGDAVIPIDSDLQDPPELIIEMISLWQGGADVVLAKRRDRSSDSILKRKTAELFYYVHNKLSHIKIPHNVGDFRLMDRKVVDALSQLPERQRFMKGLFAWVGFRIETIEYVRTPRAAGKTKFSGFKLWNLALEGITSFSTTPLRIWTYIGGFGTVFALFYAVFIVLKTMLYGADVPGYASLLVAVLFIGSLQLVGIGILGEYVGRIYMETKRRPTYIVRQKIENKHES
jgi:glycosyltransferase involved in cell wall biosynthesis